ncbi:MAG: hypothetical protein QN131_15285, partial [Armatimonadota bacterium]|nr:hypothetical protein [Armatimonadota bacterium]
MRPLSRKVILAAADALLLNGAVLFAFLIRFEGNPPHSLLLEYEKVAAAFTLLSLGVFSVFGLYSSLWRYASVDEVFTVLKGTTAAAGVLTSLVYVWPPVAARVGLTFPASVSGFPRSIVILTWLLATLFIGGLRFSVRLSRRAARVWRFGLGVRPRGAPCPGGGVRRVLVVG